MANKKNGNGSYAGIPRQIIRSESYARLSLSARALLVELCFQYRGSNNGDLTLAYSVLKQHGWNSRNTIERARDELLRERFIVVTRQGRFKKPGGCCSLYALTWQSIDASERKTNPLDMKPTTLPLRLIKDF